MRSRLLIILFLFPGFNIFAQEKLDSIRNILTERGEVYVSLEHSKYKSAPASAFLPGFDKFSNNAPFLYLTNKDSLFIKQFQNEINIQMAPSMLFEVKMATSPQEVLQGLAYADYPLYLEIMKYFADNWPEVCSIDTIGYTVNGRLLLAANIAKNLDQKPHRPSFFYSSSMHGDETLGYSFMLMLINELLININDPKISTLLENVNIYINPLENPDGSFYTSDTTIFGSVRSNANGVDLNRNYPNPVNGDHPDFNSWQTETIAMMNYLQKIKPDLSANFHGGAEVVNYPWDSFIQLHPDDDWLRFISSEYADTAMALRSGYMSEFPGGITNGWDWYYAFGTKQDYVTSFLGGREVTIELFNTKTVPEYLIKDLWETNKNSLINYMRQAEYGLQGIIIDSISELPVEAKIEIKGHDDKYSLVYSDSSSGFFVRYLKEGLYEVEISADGYQTYRLKDLRIFDYTTKFVNVKLKLTGDTLAPTRRETTIEGLFRESLQLKIENPGNEEVQLRIYGLDGKLAFVSSYNLETGTNDILLSPIIPQGIYILKLLFRDQEKTFKIFKY